MPNAVETILSRRLDQQLDNPKRELGLNAIGAEFDAFRAAVIDYLTRTWIGTTEGVWVDRIGEIVGVKRPPEEEVERVFRCRSASDPDVYDALHGFGTAADPDVGGFLSSAVYGVPKTPAEQAGDVTYLDFIAAKIAANNTDASIPGIAKYIFNAFGIECTVTAAAKKIYIELLGEVDLRQRRFLKLFMPNVAGTECEITNWSDWG
jgi:hypothetical protein